MHEGMKPVIWLTGLSGAGKTTLANLLQQKFQTKHTTTIVLDGDEIRKGLCKDLGYSLSDRTENIRRVAEVASLLNKSGILVICSLISPLISQRALAKQIIGEEHFIECFVKTSLEECIKRDTKGVYQHTEVPGLDQAYEEPANPALILDTQQNSAEELSEKIFDYCKKAAFSIF